MRDVMEFGILGPLEVIEGGEKIDLGGLKQRTLLAVLLLHANEVVSSDRLIEALWEDDRPETAQKALQVYVSQVRKLLGKARLETRPPGYVLRVSAEELDLARFRVLREEARPREALRLWRGEPLGDFAYQRFAQTEIARLEQERLGCMEERIDAELAEGRHAEVVAELEGLAARHPLRERLRRQLMLALYRSGRQAEALDVYQHARKALVEELGIEPSREVRELHQAILNQDPALDVVSSEIGGADSSRGPFVGREAELAELACGLDDAFAGRGRLFLLVGEPGIGKSRLADELIRRARGQGAIVLVGRCWEAGGAPAFWPWVQSLRAYAERTAPDALREQLSAGAAEVAQIVPELRQIVPDLPELSTLEAESARFRLFDATARFLRNAASVNPIVLVLDDLQAADEPSLLLLRFLAGELPRSRILVVGTYRNVDPTVRDPLATTLAELAREQVTQRLELTGLAPPDVADYVELTAGATPSPELVSAIHSETEGNPLFVGEVARLLAAEGRLADIDAEMLWTLGIPQGVREVISRRLRRLSEECARTLTLACVIGREFGLDALGRVADLPSNMLLEVLDEAVSARVVTAVPDARGRLRFAHALIRETLYDQLTTPRRVQLHRHVAVALEELYAHEPGPRLAELAYHFFEAAPGGDVDKALCYTQQAGDRALDLLAFEEAARFYELALQALELKDSADQSTRCELLLCLGEARARAGDEATASATFLEAAEIARSTRSADQLARAALGYGGRFVWLVRGADADVVPLLDDALRELGGQESALRAKVLARLAGALRDQPEPERRTELTAQAVEIARRLEDRSALAYALDGMHCAVWGPDNPTERVRIADELIDVSAQVGDRERRIQGHYYRAMALLELGRIPEVRHQLDVIDRLAGELRQPAQRWYVEVLRTILALFEGEFDTARQSIRAGLDFAQKMRSRMGLVAFQVQSSMLKAAEGKFDEGIALVERSVAETPTLTAFRCILAGLYAEGGRTAEARVRLDELAEDDFEILPDNDKLFGWSLLGEVCYLLDDPTHASRLYELLSPYAERNVVCHPGCAIGSAARYLGLLASSLSRWDRAERHFERALELNEEMNARPWLARTQEDFAQMLIARDAPGDRERAGALTRLATTAYRAVGMQVRSNRRGP